MEVVCPICGDFPAAIAAQGCLSAPDLLIRMAGALIGPDHQCLLLVEGAPKDVLAGALKLVPAYALYDESQGRALLGPAGTARL